MRRFVQLLALCCVLALVATACGKTKDTGFPTPSPSEPTASASKAPCGSGDTPQKLTGPIDVCDLGYTPKMAEVAKGDEVTWTVTGAAPHNVVFDNGKFDSHPKCSASDTGACTKPGETFKFTVNLAAGKYHYYCVIHGQKGVDSGMYGYIVVA
jgi:plastocyanin